MAYQHAGIHPIPISFIKTVNEHQCRDCAETKPVPRTPKIFRTTSLIKTLPYHLMLFLKVSSLKVHIFRSY